MHHRLLEQLCAEADRLTSPVVMSPQGRRQALSWSTTASHVGLGAIDGHVVVPTDVEADRAVLAIPYDPKAASHLDESTIRMHWFDARARRHRIVRTSERHPRLAVVLGPAAPDTRYGLIGRPLDSRVRATVNVLCGLRTSAAGRLAPIRDRLCELVLCAPDFTDAAPGPDPAPLPAGTCERCRALDLDDLLDCELTGVLEVQPACPPPRWESLGPDTISGAIRQVVIDPNDRRRLYAVAANGGLWCLDNVDRYPTTLVWRPLTERLGQLRFRTLAVAPNDAEVLYAASVLKQLQTPPSASLQPAVTDRVFCELWRSRDRGSSWLPIHHDELGVVHRMAVDPRDPDRLLAATSTGLWEWGAAGAWRQRSTRHCTDVVIDRDDPRVVYVAVHAASADRGVYRSTNEGRSLPSSPFIPVPVAEHEIGRVALGIRNADGTAQTASSRTVVARYGNTVRSRTVGTAAVVVSDASTATVNASGTDTSDPLGGGSQNRSDLDPPIRHEWVNCLDVDPFDPERIFVGGVSLFRVQAGSGDWELLAGDPPHEDYHAIAFDPQVEDLVYVANDGGVFSSGDGGDKWPKMTPDHIVGAGAGRARNFAKGLVTAEFRSAVVGGSRVAGAIDHSGLIVTEATPGTWALWSLQSGGGTSGRHEGGLLRACPANDHRFYMARRVDRDPHPLMLHEIVVTPPNGPVEPVRPREIVGAELHLAPFPQQPMYFPDDQIYLAHRPAPVAVRRLGAGDGRLFVYGAPASVSSAPNLRLRTFQLFGNEVPDADGNLPATITDVVTHPAAFVDMTFQPGDPDRMFALAADGALVAADVPDLAASAAVQDRWEVPAIDRFATRLVAAHGHRAVLYAISPHAVAQWRDGGRWQTRAVWADPGESLLCLAVHPDESSLLFLGTSRGLHVSEDGGVSWRSFDTGLPTVPVVELAFHKGMLRAATLGRGLWQCRPVG